MTTVGVEDMVHEPTCQHCGEPAYSAEEVEGCGSCAHIVGPLKAENERLRAVADAAREFCALAPEDSPSDSAAWYLRRERNLRDAVRALNH